MLDAKLVEALSLSISELSRRIRKLETQEPGTSSTVITGNKSIAFAIGKVGAIPAAPANDQADFMFPVPYNIIIKQLKAISTVTLTNPVTIQVRHSTDGGISFYDVVGVAVNINAGSRLGIATVTDYSIVEGEVLNFSIVSGGNTGNNLTLLIIGELSGT